MSQEPSLPSKDAVHAGAMEYLIQGGNLDIARQLLECEIEDFGVWDTDNYRDFTYSVYIRLRGPRPVYEALNSNDSATPHVIRAAFDAILDHNCSVDNISIRVNRPQITGDWKEFYRQAIDSPVSNQAAGADRFRTFMGLRYRSASEVKIAEALERADAMYFPNCRARLLGDGHRITREPDFLVCAGGNWGILEVDGEPFHPPTRTVQDHSRDRLFRRYGIKVVEHFDSGRCFDTPDQVVREFLDLLR